MRRGPKSGYDGVVMLLAMRERRARIAIGRGLVAKLTDRYAQQIMDKRIIPRLRKGTCTAVSTPAWMKSSQCWEQIRAESRRSGLDPRARLAWRECDPSEAQ